MEQGTCGELFVRGTLWSRVHMGSRVLGVPYGAGYMWGVECVRSTLWSRVHVHVGSRVC